MSSELERRLLAVGEALPAPPAAVTNRVRQAVLEGVQVRAPSRLRRSLRLARRPAALLLSTAAAGGIAVLLALLITNGPTAKDATPASLRPDLSSLTRVRLCKEPRLHVPCVVGTARVRAATPALVDAPWLYGAPVRRLGREPARPSLVFPPGTTYGQALDALYVSVVLTGGLPPGTTLGPPLPSGAVLLKPDDPAQGIALDLRAPLGYTPPHGTIFSFLLAGRPDGPRRGRLWPSVTRIAVPTLPACMIVSNRASLPPACGPKDQPVIRGDDPSVAPLPDVGVSAGLIRPEKRVAAPPLTLPVLSSATTPRGAASQVSLDSLHGRVVVVGLTASWCEPCRGQVRALDAMAIQWREEGVTVLGVATNDLTAKARRFLRPLAFVSLRDPTGVAAAGLGGTGLPETVLIDKQGRVALRLPGTPIARRLDEGIAELVAESP